MRVTLPESGRGRQRSFGGTAASTLLHALVIGGVVVSTGYSAERLSRPEKPEQVVLFTPRDPLPKQPAPVPADPRPDIATNLITPPSVDVPPISFTIPEGLPPIDSRIGTMTMTDFITTARDTLRSAGTRSGHGDAPMTGMMVERQVMARAGNAPPRYPGTLRNTGVEGVVYAQFVVDTTGRVERESIRFIRSDHQLFEHAVNESLLRSRYSPAEAGGRKVRQLVEQAFSFAVER